MLPPRELLSYTKEAVVSLCKGPSRGNDQATWEVMEADFTEVR
jgi:hypothetical protein